MVSVALADRRSKDKKQKDSRGNCKAALIRATLSAHLQKKRIYTSFAAVRPLSLCAPESPKGHTVPSRGENKEIIDGDQ